MNVDMGDLMTKKDSRYNDQMGAVLSIYHELTGSENIQFCMKESGGIIPRFKASELT